MTHFLTCRAPLRNPWALSIAFLCLALFVSPVSTFANSGIFESSLILNANQTGNTYYDLQATTGNPDFQGANLGSFSCDNSLVLNGGQNKTFKCSSDDITGGSLLYRVYLQGSAGGAFNAIGFGFASNDSGAGQGCQNQTWQELNAGVNLLNDLTAGTYVVEVYTQAPYTSNGGPGIRYSNNGGLNYTATFTVGTPSVANISGGFCTNTTVTLSPEGDASIVLSDVYNGLFTGCEGVVVTLSQSAFTCADIGVKNITVTATDGSGNTTSCTAWVTVVFETAPNGFPISGCGCAAGEWIALNDGGGSVITAADCVPCPVGSSCDGFVPTPCPPGSFSNLPGAAECTLCPAGTYQGGLNQTGCIPCEEGFISAPGAVACADPCGPGGIPEIIPAAVFNDSRQFVNLNDGVYEDDMGCAVADIGQKHLWFRFTAGHTNSLISARREGAGNFNGVIEVYEGCSGMPILCQDDYTSLNEVAVFPTEIGQEYTFKVYHNGATVLNNSNISAAVAFVPPTELFTADCGRMNLTDADIIRSNWPPNQFLLEKWMFEFKELEAPYNTYHVISPNGTNPQFRWFWFQQREPGRTYEVRTKPLMYQGPTWADWGTSCVIGTAPAPAGQPAGLVQTPGGSASVSNEVGIQLWPNPAQNEVNISFRPAANDNIADISIFDVSGKEVDRLQYAFDRGVFQNIVYTNERLVAGIYLFHIRTESGTSFARLVVTN